MPADSLLHDLGYWHERNMFGFESAEHGLPRIDGVYYVFLAPVCQLPAADLLDVDGDATGGGLLLLGVIAEDLKLNI